MAENLVLDGDFQQGNGGEWTCGPGCAIQAQQPCTSRCATLRAPQTLSQWINIEQAQVGQTLNFTMQASAISTASNPQTKQVDVWVSFGNITTAHTLSIYTALETASFSSYTQNVTIQSTSTPMIIYLRDDVDVYDYDVYIQSVSLTSKTSNSSTSSTAPSDTTNQLEDAKSEITVVAVGILVPTAAVILLMACGTFWWLRGQRLFRGELAPTTGVTIPNNQTYELQPQAITPRALDISGGTDFESPISHLPLDLESVHSERRSVELPSTPLEPSPETAEPEDTRSPPSIIDDPIGQYAAIYRNKISRQLEEKLRKADFMPHHDPNAISEEVWFRELNVGPFELERLKEIFDGRWGRPVPPAISSGHSILSLRYGYPYPLNNSVRELEQASPPTYPNLEDWANEHRTLISSELEAKLRRACYQPLDNPDRLPAALWQANFGVGGFELQLLRQLYRQRSTS